MQRSLSTALHGFAVSDGNFEYRFEDVRTAFLSSPGAWEPYRRAFGREAPSQSSKGLADYNPRSTSPSDVWANVKPTHRLCPRVMACKVTNTSFRAKQIAPALLFALSAHSRTEHQTLPSWRFSRCRFPVESTVLPYGYIFVLSRCLAGKVGKNTFEDSAILPIYHIEVSANRIFLL